MLVRHALQMQSVLELANELKPDCLLNTLVLWLCANELVTKIISAMGSIPTMGYGTIFKKQYYPNIQMLRLGILKKIISKT